MAETRAQAAQREARAEANRIADCLASMPGSHTATTTRVVRELMLSTGGQLMVNGYLYEIKAKSLGAGVHRVSLKRWVHDGD